MPGNGAGAIRSLGTSVRPSIHLIGRLKSNVVDPYNALLKRRGDAPGPRPPFTIEMKKVEKSYGLKLVLDSIEHLQHANDGLIFTSAVAPYTLGTCEKMLKWKPPEMNSIDFKVRLLLCVVSCEGGGCVKWACIWVC